MQYSMAGNGRPSSTYLFIHNHARVRLLNPPPVRGTVPPDRSADFPVCCIAGFPTRVPSNNPRRTNSEIGDPTSCETMPRPDLAFHPSSSLG